MEFTPDESDETSSFLQYTTVGKSISTVTLASTNNKTDTETSVKDLFSSTYSIKDVDSIASEKVTSIDDDSLITKINSFNTTDSLFIPNSTLDEKINITNIELAMTDSFSLSTHTTTTTHLGDNYMSTNPSTDITSSTSEYTDIFKSTLRQSTTPINFRSYSESPVTSLLSTTGSGTIAEPILHNMTLHDATPTPVSDISNDELEIGSVIGGVVAGVSVLLVAFLVVCCIKRKCKFNNSRNNTRNKPNASFDSEYDFELSAVSIEMQPSDNRIQLPEELKKPRESFFRDFSSFFRSSSIRSTKSTKSANAKTTESDRTKTHDQCSASTDFISRSSRLFTFMRQTLFRRRSRSFTNQTFGLDKEIKVRKSRSLTDLTTIDMDDSSKNIDSRQHISGGNTGNENNPYDSGINCDSIVENLNF